MRNFDFVKFLNKSVIISAVIMLVGIILTCIFGVNLDISFAGGSRFTYSYVGDIDAETAEKTISDSLGLKAEITQNSDFSGDSQKLVITFSGDITKDINKDLLSSVLDKIAEEEKTAEEETKEETSEESKEEEKEESKEESETEDENVEEMVKIQSALAKVLSDAYSDGKLKLNESNSVNPTIAVSFLIKSIVAVIIAGIGVVIYIAIRFRKIGGISAGLFAFVALLHDIIVAFFIMSIFGLQIDTNFFAVVLTLLGYSLNDTIVIFDRIRENKKYYTSLTIRENVNKSINETLARSVMTALTTFVAITAVVVVAEFFGVTALRSFAIPMAIGVLSGCYSSVFLSGPIWVKWSEFKEAKLTAKQKK
jgi:preprotein translocase subunit SecF